MMFFSRKTTGQEKKNKNIVLKITVLGQQEAQLGKHLPEEA